MRRTFGRLTKEISNHLRPLRSGMNTLLLLLAGLAVLTGCDGASGPGSGSGEVRMYMVDAPADVEAVMIVVNRVEVHTAGSAEGSGWVTVNDQPATYDLLSLRNGAQALVASGRLSAGHYTQIRLVLGSGSHVMVNGSPVTLQVASGFQTGVKLNHQFTIESDQTYALTLDFDAERSLQQVGLTYRLTPVIRVVVNQTSGSISGTVAPAAARARVTAVSGIDTASTTVADSSSGFFKFAALMEGSYNLHFNATQGLYRDTVLTNVLVSRQNNTSVGTVTLQPGTNP